MASPNCVVVAIQRDEAKLYFLDRAWANHMPVRPEFPDHHILRRRDSGTVAFQDEDQRYFGHIVRAIEPATMVLLIGEPQDQEALEQHIRSFYPRLWGKVVCAGRSGAIPRDRQPPERTLDMQRAAGD